MKKFCLDILKLIVANKITAIGIIILTAIFTTLMRYDQNHLWFLPVVISFLLIILLLSTELIKKKQNVIEFKVKYYEGESGPLSFDVIMNNRPIDLTSKTIAMIVKNEDVTIISKTDRDFDKTYAKKGRVSVFLNHTDLSQVGVYRGQIQINYASGEIRKTDPFDFEILPSIIGKVRQLTTTCIAVSVASDVEMQIN